MRLAVLALTAALFPLSAVAESRDWHILNFGTGQCVRPKAMQPQTPEAMHQQFRKNGFVDSVKVQKDDDGNVLFVGIEVTVQGTPESLFWFPSAEKCELARSALQEKGELPNDDDLK